MNTIWFLSQDRNLIITGFNKVTKRDKNGNNKTELWVKETDGSSRKLAEGDKADKLEQHLLNTVWDNFPSILFDGENFGTNVQTEQQQEVEE